MNESTICFVNSTSVNERILVSDAQSAEILKRLFAQLENNGWKLESEIKSEKQTLAEEILAGVPLKVEVSPVAAKVESRPGQEFRVILTCGVAAFRCQSCEVSREGMKLKKAVPEKFNHQKCVAYVSHDQMRENIELSCEVVTDASGVSRLEFVSPKATDLEKLSEWMAEATA